MNNLSNLSPGSKVWIYQSTRELSDDEVAQITREAQGFVKDWAAHGNTLAAAADVLYNRFLVLMVDETQAAASGCSIDKSVNFVHRLEDEYNTSFFDRMQVAYRDENNEIKACTLAEFETLIESGRVNENTIVFNNLVTTKEDFQNRWQTLLKNSWHNQLIL